MNHGDVTGIRGLHLRRDGRMVFTGDQEVVAMDDLPPPDFTNFEPETYPTNDGAVCLTFARGCSWSKCAFCTQFITFSGYRTMSDEKVAEHIAAVTRRHRIRTISLNDENVTPERLRAFGAIVGRTAPGVKWMTLARLSPALADRALAGELAASGCVMLSLGLESADQKVLNLNRKGIAVQAMPAILRSLHRAGIWVHVFVIFGLPGETSASALRTIGFIHDHLDMIDSVSPTVFRLERHSAIWQDPPAFDVVCDPVPDDWCAVEMPCDTKKWMTRGESLIFIEYMIHSLVGRRQCPIEQGDLNGQYLIQLLERRGTAHLRTEMETRAGRSAAAGKALIADDALFREWMQTPVFATLASHTGTRDVLLSLPANGIFLFLNYTGQRVLKLRSLGLPLDDIQKAYRRLVSAAVEDDVEMEWKIDTFILLLLTSRIIQDGYLPAEPGAPVAAEDANDRCDMPVPGLP